MENKEAGFRVHGRPLTQIKLSSNEVRIYFKCLVTVEIEGEVITVFPAGVIDKGLLFGKIKIVCDGNFYFYYSA